MPIIKTVKPEQAEGEVKEVYSLFDRMGMVPMPMQMLSSSPPLLGMRKDYLAYFMNHPTLKPGLLALIRMLVAEEHHFYYCISLNRKVLAAMGIADEDQAARIIADPASAPLEEKDKALLLFVLKAVKTPGETTVQDIQGLRDLGWSDQDMVEALAHGTAMVANGIMFEAFKMDEGASC